MDTITTLTTSRLTLRPFSLDDVPDVTRLAGDRDVASTTLLIPHPYEPKHAEEWIRTHTDAVRKGESITWAVTLTQKGTLIGAMGLTLERDHGRAEIGYWIGKPFWNRGYATDACRATIEYALRDLGMNRVFAYHYQRNPASGRVMEKAGMIHEGCLRGHVRKWGEFEDCVMYGITRSDLAADA